MARHKAPKERLLLVNTYHTDLVVTLMQMLPVRTPGADRGRMRPVAVHLKRGRSVDLCELLGTNKEGAVRILEASPEATKMRHMLRLVDPSDNAAARAQALEAEARRVEQEKQRREAEAKLRHEALLAHEMKKLAEKEKLAAEERALREAEMAALSVPVAPGADAASALSQADGEDPFAKPFEVEDTPDAPAPEAALEPGLREQLADSIPSTRWSLEKLRAYAEEKGIETEGLSKNAILRKLRGA